jgi:glycosyltransferase involved in cell wall biosynthesis
MLPIDDGELPLVSVVIPVYNGERTISECINSVISQRTRSFRLEIIVYDNASTDGTLNEVRNIEDPRVRILTSSENIGGAANWNRVSKLAKGDYVKLLPSDDVLLPDCLEEQVNVLQSCDEAVMACSSRIVVTQEGKHLPLFLGKLAHVGYFPGNEIILKIIRSGRSIGEPGAILFRGPEFRKTLPWQKDAGYAIDADFYLRILKHGGFLGLAGNHATFRLSIDSWSNSVANRQFSDLYQVFSSHLKEIESKAPVMFGFILRVRIYILSILRILINYLSKHLDFPTREKQASEASQ